MEPDKVEALELKLKETPGDVDTRTRLLGYYFNKQYQDRAARDVKSGHILWLIENAAESEVLALPYGTIDKILDSEAYAQAASLWSAQLKQKPDNLKLLANSSVFYSHYDKARATEALQKLTILDGDNPKWYMQLGVLQSLDLDRTTGQVKPAAALQSLASFETAYQKSSDDEKNFLLGYLAKMAFAADKLEQSRKYAELMLADTTPGWNRGNHVHHGNLILGRIALKTDKLDEAKNHLLAAGKTSGSPQLNSFGPNMTLAKDLLELGETEVVLEYFDLCEKFWKSGQAQLNQWRVDVQGGNVPEFGGNLLY